MEMKTHSCYPWWPSMQWAAMFWCLHSSPSWRASFASSPIEDTPGSLQWPPMWSRPSAQDPWLMAYVCSVSIWSADGCSNVMKAILDPKSHDFHFKSNGLHWFLMQNIMVFNANPMNSGGFSCKLSWFSMQTQWTQLLSHTKSHDVQCNSNGLRWFLIPKSNVFHCKSNGLRWFLIPNSNVFQCKSNEFSCFLIQNFMMSNATPMDWDDFSYQNLMFSIVNPMDWDDFSCPNLMFSIANPMVWTHFSYQTLMIPTVNPMFGLMS